MKQILLLLLGLILTPSLKAQDGPYITYDRQGRATVIAIDTIRKVTLREFSCRDNVTPLEVVTHGGKYRFEVDLHDFIEQPSHLESAPDRMVVISDPHAQLAPMISILESTGVINSDLDWSFGDGTLMILGDILDRGNDATQIMWLVYKLEAQAANSGGRVTFLVGNHEDLLLGGDIRYVEKKYLTQAQLLATLWHENNELASWIRSKNAIQIVGSTLFVHAGLSEEFLGLNLEIEQVNAIIRNSFGKTRDQKSKLDPVARSLMGSNGPLWYRGLVSKEERYSPIDPQTLDQILNRYGVKRIVVGHTIFKDVTTLHDGKVIAVNVANRENMEKRRSRGLLIQGDTITKIFDQK